MDQLQEKIQEDEIKEEVPEETPPAPPEIATEVIDRAKGMGWIPEEEFKGDKKRWRPANEYVQRADEMLPIMKSQMGKYETKISTLENTIEDQRKTTEKLIKMSEKVGEEAYKRAKRDITQQQVQAVTDGDVETWQKLEDKKDDLKPPEPVEPVKTEPEPLNPAFEEWHGKNDWYLKDKEMTNFANEFGRMINPNNEMAVNEWYSKVEDRVKAVYPDKFTNPARANASPVDGGSVQPAPSSSDGDTYTDLPADVKTICNQNVKDGLYKNKEAWAKAYFEEE
jgi:chromosome segregation ATPase